MSGIFGVVGKAESWQLDEMAARLKHRGASCTWQEVAHGVRFGTCAPTACSSWRSGSQVGVVDVAESPGNPQALRDAVLDEWWRNGIDGLRGAKAAFSFVVWDEKTRSLYLGRDSVGLRPLYFARLPGGGIAFATEYKALLAIPELPAEPDLDAIQHFQGAKLMPGSRNLLKNIHSAMPGILTRLGADGTETVEQRMQALRFAVKPISEDAACRLLTDRFMEASRELVIGRSQIAVAVSGGIDSISVAYACRMSAPDANFLGFTVGHGPDDPEVRTASIVMERLGGQHEVITVKPRLLEERLPLLVWHLENPIGRSEAFQFLELGRAAARHGVRTIFSGFWADALFAGMPRHKLMWLAGMLPPLRKDLVEYYALVTGGRPVQRPIARLMERLTLKGVGDVPRIVGSDYRPELPELPPPGPEFLNRTLVANAAQDAARSLMRITMPLAASGIDVLSPFLSRSVMECAFTLSGSLKIRRGKEKYILRKALRSIVPKELVDFPKFPMRMHYDEEFASTLDRLAAEYLSTGSIKARGFFRQTEIEGLIRMKRNGKYSPEGAMRVWTAIVTEIWARQFIDRRGAGP